jgi:hypothetical protein
MDAHTIGAVSLGRITAYCVTPIEIDLLRTSEAGGNPNAVYRGCNAV